MNDIMIELDVLIANRPKEEQWTARFNPIHTPLPALKDIAKILGFYDYPRRSRTVDLSKQEHPHYASLGAVDDFTDDFLLWAYERQCEHDPANKPYYLDCLRGIAQGRKSSELEMKVAMAASAGEVGLQEVQEAYKFFALDPNTREGDEYIIGVYNSRIESAPRQKDEARDCLRVIAKARNSQKIESVANDRAMTFEEALAFLNVTADTQSDSIEAAAVAMVSRPLAWTLNLLFPPDSFVENIYLTFPRPLTQISRESLPLYESLHINVETILLYNVLRHLWNPAQARQHLTLARHTTDFKCRITTYQMRPFWHIIKAYQVAHQLGPKIVTLRLYGSSR